MEDFITQYKESFATDEQNKVDNSNLAFDNSSLLGEYYKNYNEARKKRGDEPMSYQDFTLKFSDIVGKMGVEDEAWSEDDYKSGAFRDAGNYQSYANSALKRIMGGINPWRGGLDQEMENAPKDVKEAYDRLKKYGNGQWGADALNDRATERFSDDKNVFDVIGSGIGTAFDALGSGIATVWNAPYNASQKNADNQIVDDYRKQLGKTAISMFDNFDEYFEKYKNEKASAKKEGGEESGSGGSESSDASGAKEESGEKATSGKETASNNDDDTVTFTLPRANDPNYRGFGAKLQELGLTTNKGLWGSDGDVEFYTQQLYDQGALDNRGNLKIGVPITLRRRK